MEGDGIAGEDGGDALRARARIERIEEGDAQGEQGRIVAGQGDHGAVAAPDEAARSERIPERLDMRQQARMARPVRRLP
jgi:hypothetical protein